MLTGSNAFSARGSHSKARNELIDKIEAAKIKFWEYMEKVDYAYDKKALKLEKEIEVAEYNMYCSEYEDNRKRNWK